MVCRQDFRHDHYKPPSSFHISILFTKYYQDDQIKKDEMYSYVVKMEKMKNTFFFQKTQREETIWKAYKNNTEIKHKKLAEQLSAFEKEIHFMELFVYFMPVRHCILYSDCVQGIS